MLCPPDRAPEKARVTAGIHRSDGPSRGTGGVLGLHAATAECELLDRISFRMPAEACAAALDVVDG